MPYDKKAVAEYLRQKQARHDTAESLSQQMIKRSREQLAWSKELLSKEVPTVWHPERPTQAGEDRRRIVQDHIDDQRELQRKLRHKLH